MQQVHNQSKMSAQNVDFSTKLLQRWNEDQMKTEFEMFSKFQCTTPEGGKKKKVVRWRKVGGGAYLVVEITVQKRYFHGEGSSWRSCHHHPESMEILKRWRSWIPRSTSIFSFHTWVQLIKDAPPGPTTALMLRCLKICYHMKCWEDLDTEVYWDVCDFRMVALIWCCGRSKASLSLVVS